MSAVTPERIGRYRITRLIGTGGMGSVWEGWDEELHRAVAIKGLRYGRDGDNQRERLRREALSTASLSHPAVTRIYEIIRDQDTDWVVMEYVPGKPLDEVLAAGPVPAADIARIGIELAEALAEAHAASIIHRDVKTENVILTPSGHVKLLDFGFAKWIGMRTDDNALSAEGMVVGTARAMSPEQALGREIDGRSDIFSLGALLYELAARRPAFRGGTPMETMVAITSGNRDPVMTAAPALRVDLAAIIERCLEIRPEDRFSSALELATALAGIARDQTMATNVLHPARSIVISRRTGSWFAVAAAVVVGLAIVAGIGITRGWFAMKRPLTIAVMPVTEQAPGDSARLASAAISDALTAQLSRLENVTLVAGREVRGVETKNRKASDIARELAADRLVEASIVQSAPGGPARIALSLTRSDGTVAWSTQLETGTDNLLILEDAIGTAIEDAFRGYAWSPEVERGRIPEEALRVFLAATDRINEGRYSPDLAEEKAAMEHVIDAAPGFLSARIGLGKTCIYRYALTHSPAELDCARQSLARAKLLAASDPHVRGLEIRILRQTGDSAGALAAATQWTRDRPGSSQAWDELGAAHFDLRRFHEAEAAYERSLALRPSWQTLIWLARCRGQVGDFDAGRKAAARALEISPSNTVAISDLAEIEMYSGNHEAAERLYRDLLARRGSQVDRLHLGNCLYYRGKFADAANAYRDAAAHTPSDYIAVANLADTELVLGQREAALGHYSQALALTDGDYLKSTRSRPLLETRARCLAQLGRGPDATRVIQEALAAFPDNPATLFMASLVAATLNENASAITYAEKARGQNAPAVWFTGPEFAGIAGDPQFAALLRTTPSKRNQ